MSTVAASCNSLATATVIDFYRRLFVREASDAHYLAAAKWATAGWGDLRLHRRCFRRQPRAAHRRRQPLRVVLLRVNPGRLRAGPRREARDRPRRLRRLIAGIAAVAYVATQMPWIAFLWHNVVGVVVVVLVGVLVSLSQRHDR